MHTLTTHPRFRTGIALAGLSLFAAILLVVRFFFAGLPLPLSLLAWPAAGFLLGLALAFFPAVSQVFRLEDEFDTLPSLLQDDLDAFYSRRFGRSHAYLALSLAAALLLSWLVLRYQKWYAHWSGVSVLAVALGAVLVVAYFGLRCRWFQERSYRLPGWAFAIPAAGFLICTATGMHYAEPWEWGGLSRLERSALAQSDNYWLATRAYSRAGSGILDLAGDGGGSLDFDCDAEECALLLLFVILVVIVVVAVGASATVPHFWVLSTAVLLTIMLIVAARELLYVPRVEPGYQG
jgi:hypothetical protein